MTTDHVAGGAELEFAIYYSPPIKNLLPPTLKKIKTYELAEAIFSPDQTAMCTFQGLQSQTLFESEKLLPRRRRHS